MQALLDALARGETVVAAGGRLVGHVRRHDAGRHRAQGDLTWESPRLFTWQGWLRTLWDQSVRNGGEAGARILISAEQRRLLWTRQLARDPALVSTRTPVRQMLAAWQLCQQWHIEPASLEPLSRSPDTALFLRYASWYAGQCREDGWLDPDALAGELHADLAAGRVRVPPVIHFAGFLAPTPQHQALWAALTDSGIDVRQVPALPVAGQLSRVECADDDDEAERAADWCREVLEGGQSCIAVALTDARRHGERLRRKILDRVWPDWRAAAGGALPVRPVEGRRLADVAPVHVALLAVDALRRRSFGYRELGQWLRTPYLDGAPAERAARARLDRRLRERIQQEASVAWLADVARDDTPRLAASLATLRDAAPARGDRREAGEWAEFADQPATAWQPATDGVPGEYVSTKTYPAYRRRPVLSAFPANGWEPFHGKEEQRPAVLGHFADSMVPLHGYRTVTDLRDESMLWDVDSKFDGAAGVYCGPGLWFNRKTARIHVRLAHTELAGLGTSAYRGETDPRKLPLCVSGPIGADVLRLNGVRHVTIRDVVIRGAAASPLVNVQGTEAVRFEGCTFFGGMPGMLLKSSAGLKLLHCAFRGNAAPWSSRASMKYRGVPSYQIITQRAKPLNHDFEFAHCEFTDDHDFAWVRYVKNLRFHHNLVDGFNDDGLELGARTRDQEVYVSQNLFSRCQLTFTLHEMDPDDDPHATDPGSGVYITRNVIDLRAGNFKTPPREPDPSGAYLDGNLSLVGDHGGPVWPHYFFYNNSVLRPTDSWRGYYGFGMGGRGLGRTRRRVFNNAFVQLTGIPGLVFGSAEDDVFVDGNLMWSVVDGPTFDDDYLATQGRRMAFRKRPWPKGWMEHDVFADPRFVRLGPDRDGAVDLRPQSGSPLVNAGVAVPPEWFDPLRERDADEPDIGAFPMGVPAWRVGVKGRFDAFGERVDEE